MRIKKDNYLFVNLNDLYQVKLNEVNKKLFKVYEYGYEKIDPDLMFKDIPEEFRRMVITIHKPFTSLYESEEYLTELPFDVSGYTKIEDDRRRQMIKGIQHNKGILFNSKLRFAGEKEVIAFYGALKANNIYEKYVESLINMFTKNEKEKMSVRMLKKGENFK